MLKKIIRVFFQERYSKYNIVIVDYILIIICLNLLYYLSDLIVSKENLIISVLVQIIIFLFAIVFKIYDSFVRYVSFNDILSLTLYLTFPSIILCYINSEINFQNIILFYVALIISLIPYRIFIKYIYSKEFNKDDNVNTVLFGAGISGVLLKRSFYNSSKYNIVGFIDDNENNHGRRIDGVYIHPVNDSTILWLKKKNVERAIFTTNKLTSTRKRFLIEWFKKINISVQDISLENLISQKFLSPAKLKNIRIEDLLPRKEVNIEFNINKEYYYNKSILITGAAGSIGSELVRQILAFEPKSLILIDSAETPLFNIMSEFSDQIKIKFILMDINYKENLNELFEKNKIDFIFHAAAYKHVSLIEKYPIAGLTNNVLGTYNMIMMAIKYDIDKFVLISTDKAVNPTNVMGATKRLCELLIPYVNNKNKKTKFITTRFGNVLGSNGSVIPIFKEQIESGGPVTVTHPEINRYFMTIPEASKLVVEAGRLGNSNQVYVFDMGEPVKIEDLAKSMIYLSGFTPYVDIDIKFVGLRDGEKLYEELLLDTEKMLPSKNSHIFISEKEDINDNQKDKIKKLLSILEQNKHFDEFFLVKLIKDIVPEFISNNSRFKKLDL